MAIPHIGLHTGQASAATSHSSGAQPDPKAAADFAQYASQPNLGNPTAKNGDTSYSQSQFAKGGNEKPAPAPDRSSASSEGNTKANAKPAGNTAEPAKNEAHPPQTSRS